MGLLLDFLDFSVGLFVDGHEEDVLNMDAARDLVLLNVGLVAGLKLLIGDLDALADLVGVY